MSKTVGTQLLELKLSPFGNLLQAPSDLHYGTEHGEANIRDLDQRPPDPAWLQAIGKKSAQVIRKSSRRTTVSSQNLVHLQNVILLFQTKFSCSQHCWS